jgi:hypothetical protein
MMEIGVWQGHGAAMLAAHLPPAPTGRKLLLIDRFVPFEQVAPVLAPFLDGPVEERVDHRRVDSILARKDGAVRATYGGRVSFTHIDGEHSYEAVTSDLILAGELLSESGIIAVDDIFDFGGPGLTEALYRWLFLNDHVAVPFLVAYRKAYLCAPKALPVMMRLCHALPDLFEAFGVPITVTHTSWGSRRPCAGVLPRVGNARYMRVNRTFEHLSFEEFYLG